MDGDGRVNQGPNVLALNYGEHLLIWALRRLVVRAEICRAVEREFADACRDDGTEVLGTFRLFVAALSYAARRRIVIAHPGSLGLTADELKLLRLIGAAQDNDRTGFDALICWFARIEVRAQLAIAARALATAFAAHDLQVSAAPFGAPTLTGRPQLRLVR